MTLSCPTHLHTQLPLMTCVPQPLHTDPPWPQYHTPSYTDPSTLRASFSGTFLQRKDVVKPMLRVWDPSWQLSHTTSHTDPHDSCPTHLLTQTLMTDVPHTFSHRPSWQLSPTPSHTDPHDSCPTQLTPRTVSCIRIACITVTGLYALACVYVCLWVCVRACARVCMCASVRACVCVCLCVSASVCLCVRARARVCV